MYKSNKYKHMIKKALLVQINLVCMNVTTVMLLSQQIRLNMRNKLYYFMTKKLHILP